jgi:hypothetical protein
MSAENFNGNDRWFDSPAANPDNGSHLDRIRDEVVQRPAEPTKFYGVNLGIVKLGVTDDGALNAGVDVFFAHAQAKVGAVNGVDAGVGLGDLAGVQAGGYAGFDRNGFKTNGGVGAHVGDVAGVDGSVNTRVGNVIGAEADGQAYLGGLGVRTGGGAVLGNDGLEVAGGGGARAGRLASVHGGVDATLNRDSHVAGAVGGHLGDLGGNVGGGLYTDGNNTLRPDLYGRGNAGRSAGAFDANPPAYYGNDGGGYGSGGASHRGGHTYGLGRPAPIESRPLPPVYEASTPENIARVDREVRTNLAHQATYTVHKGDTYQKIAERLHPNDPQAQIDQFAAKLEKMHHENGFHSLKAGQKITTEDPYAIDRHVKLALAQHFGWNRQA